MNFSGIQAIAMVYACVRTCACTVEGEHVLMVESVSWPRRRPSVQFIIKGQIIQTGEMEGNAQSQGEEEAERS